MADRINASFEIYGESSNGKGLTIVDYSFPIPEVKVIHESVPFRDDFHDFTFINGKPYYEPRKITITARYDQNDWQERGNDITELTEWLYGKPISEFTCDMYDNYLFYMKCDGITATVKSYCIEYEISFTGQPYKVNKNTGGKYI